MVENENKKNFFDWILVLSLIFAGTANALDCTRINPELLTDCSAIIESSLNQTEKDYFIRALMNTNPSEPDYSLIEDWDNGIKFNLTNPNNAVTGETEYIKNAWLSIISISPSIISEGKTYTNNTGKITARYNYSIQIPDGTLDGDCRTNIYLNSLSENIGIYLNESKISSSSHVEFTGSGELKAILDIDLSFNAEHYKTERYCCCTGKSGCCGYCEECNYANTEEITSHLTLSDSRNTYAFPEEKPPEIRLINTYRGTNRFYLNTSEPFTLRIGNSSLSFSKYYYSIEQSGSPYEILYLQAHRFNTTYSEKIIYEKKGDEYTIYSPSKEPCSLTIKGHFQNTEYPCDLNSTEEPINITTDKFFYKDSEKINLNFSPKNTPITIKYSNHTIQAENNATLTAEYPYNKITLGYGKTTAEKFIIVNNSKTFGYFVSIGIIALIIYSGYNLSAKLIDRFL